jgi:hypothetical protein
MGHSSELLQNVVLIDIDHQILRRKDAANCEYAESVFLISDKDPVVANLKGNSTAVNAMRTMNPGHE